ncbi:MAG: ZTL protein [Vicinamibacterales bacterium]
MARGEPPSLYVLAGPNGGGKSSIGGAAFRQLGADYFNPDEATRLIRGARRGLSEAEANSLALHQGKRLLEQAIAHRQTHAFETTLGGETITSLLLDAAAAGIEIRMWYVGLATPELHIARVAARVRRGGHSIPAGRIRQRYDSSRRNLIRLLPHLAELRLFDNSVDGDPAAGIAPQPLLVLQLAANKVRTCPVPRIPRWAAPIVEAALRR